MAARKPNDSFDSFRPVSEDQSEKILRELGGVEGRFLAHLSTVHQDVQSHSARLDAQDRELVALKESALKTDRTNDKIDALDTSVRRLLESDANQYQQLAAIQQARNAGGKWGAIVSLLVSIVIAYVASRLGIPLPR